MKITILLLFLLGPLFVFSQAVVETQQGQIMGTTSADQAVHIFKGIPFAAPPVGDLRWQTPRPVSDWQGIKDCTSFSASPIQNNPEPFLCWTEEFIAQPEPLSEDCLYLNVWTTAKAKEEKQPVFVWIYGGGFSSGSANCDIYDGEEMARQGVVFVSINYRVGIMGFMAHPELSKEADYGTSGNYGLLDQVAALQWVQENIAAFGGDPEMVTIAGQSAGAYSVNALITSPLAKGLFAQAILQSGGMLSGRPIEDMTAAENMGLDFMEKVGATSLSDLRAMPASSLQQENSIGFSVALDGHVLPADLVGHYEKGRQHQRYPSSPDGLLEMGHYSDLAIQLLKLTRLRSERSTVNGQRTSLRLSPLRRTRKRRPQIAD
jgi:para-nitrobenzyl esterase